jgi:hypothetical protein
MPKIIRRFENKHAAAPQAGIGLSPTHPAIQESRTLFPTTVVNPQDAPRLLISGKNQRKLGDRVTKGHWKDMPIFCLTLEERATCPPECHHWRSCYGNGMPQSRRHRHGAALEYLLDAELAEKAEAYPFGFVVRLHILGDFYDAAYAALWARWLEKYPELRVFGFTARDESSDIGLLIRAMNAAHPDRCVIRFSRAVAGAVPGVRYATALWSIPDGPTADGAVVCPAQTEKTDCCGSCGFCWTGTKPVAFIAHGKVGRGIATNITEAQAEDDLTTQRRHLPAQRRTLDSDVGGPRMVRRKAKAQMQQKKTRQKKGVQSLQGRRGQHEIMQPGVTALLDPEHFVPATAVDIRVWLRRAGGNPGSFPDDEQLLKAANRYRDLNGLPRFRLSINLSDLDQSDLKARDINAA